VRDTRNEALKEFPSREGSGGGLKEKIKDKSKKIKVKRRNRID
jgi:hypothetical protein